MTIPPGSIWIFHGRNSSCPGRGMLHRVMGVMKKMPRDEKWKEPAMEFIPANFCNFSGPEASIEISTWSIQPMIEVPLGMDTGVAGFSWLGSLRDFCANFEPYK